MFIETALGMANVEAIAQSSRRLEAMSFGVADYAASTRARTTMIGGVNADYGVLTDKDASGNRAYYWADSGMRPYPHDGRLPGLWACVPIDGPFGDFSDADGFCRGEARRGAWLRGKMGDPSLADRTRQWGVHAVGSRGDQGPPHRRAMAEAAKAGKGAVSLDGRLIDIASIRMAEALLKKAAAMGAAA